MVTNTKQIFAFEKLLMKNRKYAIVDIETTGGMHVRDKIIEIAIIVTDGKTILSEFQSLVHPERSIPAYITRITGINDSMVVDAPKFYEIAKSVIEHTEGCIFVAHNVRFDYNFIKTEFKSLGYHFNRKRLCTVKLSRSTIKGLKSYGLDSLIQHYDLQVDDRHRAYGDTYATYIIFKDILSKMHDSYHVDMLINEGLDASVLPKGMDIEEVHNAPEAPGVYYMSNAYDNIMYVGKAKDIKARIFQHFRKISSKSNMMHGMITRVHYQETGNELMALLLELFEIKRLRPDLNKALRRNQYNYALYHSPNAPTGKPKLLLLKNNNKNDLKYEKLRLFGTKWSAYSKMQVAIAQHELCIQYFKNGSKDFNCHCEGHCTDLMDMSMPAYEALITEMKYEWEEDFIIVLEGREIGEKGFVMIHNRQFWGMGYIPADATINSREQWNDYIEYQFWYPEASGIVKGWMNKIKVKKIML